MRGQSESPFQSNNFTFNIGGNGSSNIDGSFVNNIMNQVLGGNGFPGCFQNMGTSFQSNATYTSNYNEDSQSSEEQEEYQNMESENDNESEPNEEYMENMMLFRNNLISKLNKYDYNTFRKKSKLKQE